MKMNFAQGIIKNIQFFLIILTPLFFVSCAEYMMLDSEVREDFKPIEFIEEKQEVIAESVKLGPKPKSKTDSSLTKIDRRTFIDESVMTDYTKIIDKNFTKTFPISINFDNVEMREVMRTFSIITGKNILVGDEVSGYVTARIVNEDWDDVLEAILEIKNVALTLNPKTNIVRIHSKEVLTAQEEYNLKRKAEIRKAMELNKSIAPVRSEIFKLYYSNPTVVKAQIEDILKNMDSAASAGEASDEESSGGSADRVKMTVDARLGSLVVLGASEDLAFIEKLINQIDVPTEQILIEAFVVEVGFRL
jgi:type IV pilus assembly protein PilQ